MQKITIKAARTAKGLTQEGLAQKLGVSRALVSKWESGQAEVKPFYLFAICHLTGFTPEDISLP